MLRCVPKCFINPPTLRRACRSVSGTKKFGDRNAFFKETFELPPEFGTVPCALVGPAVGMPPISEDDVYYIIRGGRKIASRMWSGPIDPSFTPSVGDAPRYLAPIQPQVRMLTVIAGPHKDEPCVLYTAYGGPLAPRSPGDNDIASWEELLESREFWSKHALIEL